MDQPQFAIANRTIYIDEPRLRFWIKEDGRWSNLITNLHRYLKPEEIGRAVVSDPFEFDAFSTWQGNYWTDSDCRVKFLNCVKNIVQLNTSRNMNRMRLVLCGPSGTASLFPPGTDNQNNEDPNFRFRIPWIKVSMKLKLISDFSHFDPKAEKEQSYIARLGNCFGPQDVSLVLEETGRLEMRREYDFTFPSSVELMWNPEHLVWEADSQVQFNPTHGHLETFGQDDSSFIVRFPKILVKLKDGAISKVLNQHFGFFGNNTHAERTLEEEISTDLVINDRIRNPVKCHRFPLIIASAKFGNLLKEASTRTINLDLSKEAILTMLHFIYYGGNHRIVTGSVGQAIELLQFGHMYELQNLVEVTTFVLLLKPGNCFTFDEGWQLYHYSERMLKLEQNSGWTQLKDRGSWVINQFDGESMKASEIYQKMLAIAENLGPAFVTVLNGTTCENDGDKVLPINLKDVSLDDCKLLFDFLFATKEYGTLDYLSLDEVLALLVLAEHILCESGIFDRKPYSVLDKLLGKPSTWFEVDHLVALFTLFYRWGWIKWASGMANKLKWFVVNRSDQLLASTKYQEMFKHNWKCAMQFTRLCMQDS